MKSSNAGESTTAVEVVNVSNHGMWLNVEGEEFFMPFERYPWFEPAPLSSVFNVQLLHGFHLRWPDLDVDLEVDALRNPEKYPLRFDPMQSMSPVKMDYDSAQDQLRMAFTPGTCEQSDEVADGVVFDYDKDGNVVGLDIEYAVKKLNLPEEARRDLVKALERITAEAKKR